MFFYDIQGIKLNNFMYKGIIAGNRGETGISLAVFV